MYLGTLDSEWVGRRRIMTPSLKFSSFRFSQGRYATDVLLSEA